METKLVRRLAVSVATSAKNGTKTFEQTLDLYLRDIKQRVLLHAKDNLICIK